MGASAHAEAKTGRKRYRTTRQVSGRNGWREVGASRSTDEAGEPDPQGTPRREGDVGGMELTGGQMSGTWGLGSVSTRLCQVADLARRRPEMVITTLAHHIDVAWLGEAYRRTRKDGAVGVDEVSAEAYAANLEDNLKGLLKRFKTGSYVAPPVRRVHIPKGDGTATRPIGIPTFEDKVLQRAVAMVLEAVFEQDFHPCSYGFRPGRSAHQALEHLWKQGMEMGGGWVLDIDIASFFEAATHYTPFTRAA